MAQVRMIGQMSGTRDGKVWPGPGPDPVDLPDDEARALVRGGMAVPVDADLPKVVVAPAGVHLPGATAYLASTQQFVEAPADAVADPEGAQQAYRDALEGNYAVEVPVGVGSAAADGGALSADDVQANADDEEGDRQRYAVGSSGVVGGGPVVQPDAGRSGEVGRQQSHQAAEEKGAAAPSTTGSSTSSGEKGGPSGPSKSGPSKPDK